MKIAKGFESEDTRQEAANLISRFIDAFRSDPDRVEKFARYDLAQDVYDDKKVPSSIEIDPDISTYQIPLLSKHTDGVVSRVCSAYNGADRYFLFRGNAPLDEREAVEADMHLALESDRFEIKARDLAYSATIKARGPFRMVYRTVKDGDGWLSEDQLKKSGIQFSGPCIEPINPNDFGVYPLYVQDLKDARMLCHRFPMSVAEIKAKQTRGEYLDDVEIAADNYENRNAAEVPEDQAPEMWSGIVRLHPGMDESKPMQAYEFTLIKGQIALLRLEEYDLPEPNYFAPYMRRDINKVYPTHSVASRLLELQGIYNDEHTAKIVWQVASAVQTVIATGYAGEEDTQRIGVNKFITFRGTPNFTVVPTGASDSGAFEQIIGSIERNADGISRMSQVAQGQLPEASQSATATSGALEGTAQGIEEYRQNFNEEMVRAVRHAQMLIARNWKDFRSFHGENLQTKSVSSWKKKYTIDVNGQGPANNPQLVVQKITSLMDLIERLGLTPIPPTLQVDIGALAKSVVNNLDLPFTPEKIFVEPDASTNQQYTEEPPIIDPAAIGELSPELLASLAGSIPPDFLGAMGSEMPGGYENGAIEVPA